MKLSDLLDPVHLDDMLTQGYVRKQTHPSLPLAIFNYTEAATYERVWNDVTMQCRGLIYNTETGEIAARPFRKFMNYGEPSPLGDIELDPNEPVVVTDKLDGSLGVLYDDGDGGAIATRGSFTSEQAIHATKVWKQRYAGRLPQNDVTLLFEIIYPQNRIVCDYGNNDDLYLLAAVYLFTGEVWRPSSATEMSWSGPIVERFPYASLAEALAAPPREGAEGLVVDLVNRNGRVKIKQADYVQLHRIITGCTARRLWEYLAVHACAAHGGVEFLVRRLMMAPDRIEEILAAGPDWQERFLRNTPEEFSDWVFDRITGMISVANLRHAEIIREYESARADAGGDRRTFALAVKDRPDAGALFGLLQNREIDTFIWRELRPGHELPYRRIDESVA
jgi:RNA ligase